jgi:alkylhydroperoxidase/carboxymuconolactone decarboxylase family protein YurZ
VTETKKVFDERNIDPVTESDAARIELEAAAEAVRAFAVDNSVAPTASALTDLTNRVLFGDLWQRPDLSARDRSLVTMSALIAIGQPEQLPFHANRAMDNGLTRAEASEVVTHVAFYAGWPKAMSAVPVLQQQCQLWAGSLRGRASRKGPYLQNREIGIFYILNNGRSTSALEQIDDPQKPSRMGAALLRHPLRIA